MSKMIIDSESIANSHRTRDTGDCLLAASPFLSLSLPVCALCLLTLTRLRKRNRFFHFFLSLLPDSFFVNVQETQFFFTLRCRNPSTFMHSFIHFYRGEYSPFIRLVIDRIKLEISLSVEGILRLKDMSLRLFTTKILETCSFMQFSSVSYVAFFSRQNEKKSVVTQFVIHRPSLTKSESIIPPTRWLRPTMIFRI